MRPFGLGTVLHHKYDENFHQDWRRPGKLLTSCDEPLPLGESMPSIQQTIFDFAWRAIPALNDARFPSRRLTKKTSTAKMPENSHGFAYWLYYQPDNDLTDYGHSSRAVIESLVGADQSLHDIVNGDPMVWRIHICYLCTEPSTNQPYYCIQRLDTGKLEFIPTYWLQYVHGEVEYDDRLET